VRGDATPERIRQAKMRQHAESSLRASSILPPCPGVKVLKQLLKEPTTGRNDPVGWRWPAAVFADAYKVAALRKYMAQNLPENAEEGDPGDELHCQARCQ
jgi:hypothetical protein